MEGFIKVAKLSDFQKDRGMCVEVGGKEVALFHIDGKVHAIKNLCPHQAAPLAEGRIEGNIVVCPWHEWRFDVVTGQSPVVPNARVRTYEVKVVGDEVFVKED